jgi:TolA-binding protein
MKLTKKTYLSTEADKLIDRKFNELGKKRNAMNVSSFFQAYKEIFFRIPKKGTNSHTTLYQESGQFIENPESSNSQKIKRLNKQLKELQSKVSELEHKNEMLKSTKVSQELEIRELKQL